jgi:DNA mismatch repair protein MSH2
LGLIPDKTLKLEHAAHLGFFFRVTLKVVFIFFTIWNTPLTYAAAVQDEKVLRAQKYKFHTLETQKNGVRFTNNVVSTLNENYKVRPIKFR